MQDKADKERERKEKLEEEQRDLDLVEEMMRGVDRFLAPEKENWLLNQKLKRQKAAERVKREAEELKLHQNPSSDEDVLNFDLKKEEEKEKKQAM